MSELLPDERGYFGKYGGRFVPETLMSVLDELTKAYKKAKADTAFWVEFESMIGLMLEVGLALLLVGFVLVFCFALMSSAHSGAASASPFLSWN